MSASAKVPVWMSVREFLAWDFGDTHAYELVDGEPRAMAPASSVHGYLQAEIGRLITNHLRAANRACDVVANPGVIPRLFADHNVRVPDLGVTCAPLRPGQAMIVDPILLVEILSPSNQAKTWTNVWAYTSIPSVTEILILRSDRVAADVLRRDGSGAWPERPVAVTHGGVMLESIGFSLDLAALYARTGLLA